MDTEDQSVKVKRKVHRSPNYPSISLGDAIEKARQIESEEKRTPASADTILRHLGYKPGVGPALRVLSALRQYGLLEEHGGLDRISEAAFNILKLSESSPERLASLKESAKRPTLIRQVVEFYKDGLPSDTNLRDHLIRVHSFNPDSVATFIKVLRETVELAKLYENDDNGREAGTVQERTDEPPNPTPKPGVFSQLAKDPEGTLRWLAGLPEQELLRYTLSGGRGVRLIFSGPEPTQNEIDELLELVKVTKRTFPTGTKNEGE